MHEIVKQIEELFNAHIPVTSQLNVEVWQAPMKDYWDQQLLRFGFPLDFNRNGPLHLEGDKSLLGYSIDDVDTYIHTESRYGAILGPFREKPIKDSQTSPFMARKKPNFDRHRVNTHLSWPVGASFNLCIYKDT